MRVALLLLVVAALLIKSGNAQGKAHVSCERRFQKVGCFDQQASGAMTMLINDRDTESPYNQGWVLDWKNIEESFHSLACRCNEEAGKKGFTYFTLAFWGECYGGSDEAAVTQLLRDRAQIQQCKSRNFKMCNDGDIYECAGQAHAEYLYKVAPAGTDGGFAPWSAWTSCTKPCGGGLKERVRGCTDPPPSGRGKDCSHLGEAEEVMECNEQECPRDGGFTNWGSYSSCSVSCGNGVQIRRRSCSKPSPAFGGKNCLGATEQSRACNPKPCPIDGKYTEYGPFSTCSKTCGTGTQIARRTCTNPRPQHGGKNCVGPASMSKNCNTNPCPVNGGLSSWSRWGGCSAGCGDGAKTRTRTCTNPRPQHGGSQCTGATVQSSVCKIKECPVDGRLSSWSRWSSCSKSCGRGTSTRSRTCTEPKHGGKKCMGVLTEAVPCNTEACPVNGGYGPWIGPSACSASCGNGVREYIRRCTNPSPANGGKNCVGPSTKTESCKVKDCPIDGGFTDYGPFGSCSRSCNGGQKTQYRTCTNPRPAHGGRGCAGSTSNTVACNTHGCPVNGNWGRWGSYSKCSATCGGGIQHRSRQCNNPAAKNGGKKCPGYEQENRVCNPQSCIQNGGWSSWTAWGTCDRHCGCAKQTRTRDCTNPRPQGDGKRCSGLSSESRDCYNRMCTGKEGIIEIQQFVHTSVYEYFRTKFSTEKISGKFYQAIFEIQKSAVASMRADKMKPNAANLYLQMVKLGDLLEAAVKGDSAYYARHTFGVFLHTYYKFRVGRGLSVCGPNIAFLIGALHMRIGEKFAQVVSQRGDATLMFTIDTTGSMRDEINAAKSISQAIINGARKYDVDYILSPFADPTTGPVTRMSNAMKYHFSNAIGRLPARAGGDCPEYSMRGILNAIEAGPRYGSPMFVFTDADAKDADDKLVEGVKMAADKSGVSLNFFMNPAGCGGDRSKGEKLYKDLASHTGGQFFGLTRHTKLTEFSKFVASTLESDTILKTKSYADPNSYTYIYVDRTMAKLIVSVSVERVNCGRLITLSDPKNKLVNSEVTMSLNRVFSIYIPAEGRWKLIVPKHCGRFEMNAKAVSVDAITFNQGFFHDWSGQQFALPYPIVGKQTDVVVQMSGIERVDLSKKFEMHVVDRAGKKIGANIPMRRSSVGQEIMIGSFTPPAGEFRFQMHGTTQAGLEFERESPQSMKALKTYVQPLEAGDGFTARAGYAQAIRVRCNIFVSRGWFYSVVATVDHGTLQNAALNTWIAGKREHVFQYYPQARAYNMKGKTAKIQLTVLTTGVISYTTTIPILLV